MLMTVRMLVCTALVCACGLSRAETATWTGSTGGAWRACAKGVDFVNIRCSNWTVDCQKLIRLYPHKAEKVTFRNLYFSNFSGVARGPSELSGLAAMPAENIVFDNVDVACKVMVKNVKPLVVRASALEIVETVAR